MKKFLRRISFLLAAVCMVTVMIGSGIMAASAEATNTPANTMEDRSVFFGKVTAIDGTSVTVAIGTLPEPAAPQSGTDGQNAAPNGQNANGQNAPANGTQQQDNSGNAPQGFAPVMGRDFAQELTLTGESVTVQITDSVKLTKRGARPQGNGNDTAPGATQAPDNSQGTAQTPGNQAGQDQNSQAGQGKTHQGWRQGQGQGMGMGGFGFSGEEAALSDITVDCVVMLTYQTSTQQLLAVHILTAPETAAN